MIVRSYLLAKDKEPHKEHRYEVTGFTEQEFLDSVDDLKMLYPTYDIYHHPECYHEFRGTSHPYANRKCTENVLVS